MGFFFILALAIPALFLLWKYSTKNHDYFKIREIPYEKPLPVLGSTGAIFFLQKESIIDWCLSMGTKYREQGYFGLFDMSKPTFLIQDLELIKEICIKKFDHFPNHPAFTSLDGDQLFIDSLLLMKDQRWKDMRATLSPAFTTSKMRLMWNLVKDVADSSIKYVKDNMKDEKYEVDTKDLYAKINVDMISTCAFGLNVNTIQEPDNPVAYHAKRAFDSSSFLQQINFMLASTVPRLANFLGLSIIPKDTSEFFQKLVKDTLEHRKRTGAKRSDVLQLLLQAMEGQLMHDKEDDSEKNLEFSASYSTNSNLETPSTNLKNNKNWTYNEISAQCFVFFIAGNETTPNILTFASYELAMNPDIQDKLYQEIKKTEELLNGKELNYEVLQQLPYLDAVVSETLRKHPPGFVLDRLCDKDVTVTDAKGKSFSITKGAQIWIDVVSNHYNFKYFPSPERFMPERFLPENRDKIVPGSYMPFGVGPRLCIGSRFALMTAKIVLYEFLKDFKIEPCVKTLTPLRYAQDFQLAPKVPLIVEFKKR